MLGVFYIIFLIATMMIDDIKFNKEINAIMGYKK